MFQLCWRTESHCLVRSFLSHQHCQEDKTKTRNQPLHQSRAVGHQHHTDHCSSSATTLIPACLSSESITWFLNCRAHTHTQLMPAVFMRTWTIHALSSAWTGYRATRPHFCFSWLSSNCQKGRWAYTWSTNRTNCGIYIDVVSIVVPSFPITFTWWVGHELKIFILRPYCMGLPLLVTWFLLHTQSRKESAD